MSKQWLRKWREFDKYCSETNLLISIAAALNPRNKMKIINFCFPVIYPEGEVARHITIVRDILCQLYEEFIIAYTAVTVENMAGDALPSSKMMDMEGVKGKGIVSGRLKFDDIIRKFDTVQNLKSELDVHLEKGVYVYKHKFDFKFDELEWWKVNNLKFLNIVRDGLRYILYFDHYNGFRIYF
ncbi:hypothetical protein Nepgr_004132 [Nepenthes gracilis]|uniref:hAT-like transposase RNase-H fold domain-containing protein n=1 Tax=Nepenthes gracilis TaxID=150966 RepID=A0AAD3XEQ4_NEPGR|nr:hypothetical protein Nepgr_004132 [Nepenthes gracilis]